MYIISGCSTDVPLPNERLATCGAWQQIFNTFLAAPVVTAVILQFFIRVILEMFLEVSASFIGVVCAVFPPGCVQMLTAHINPVYMHIELTFY